MRHTLARLGLLACLSVGAAALLASAQVPAGDPDWAAQREAMVDQQIRARGVRNRPVLTALGKVPRHEFVPADVRRLAYADGALPIGHEQTISQPYIVAVMTEAIDPQPGQRVLEIG